MSPEAGRLADRSIQLSALLNSTADTYSNSSGRNLVSNKVSELIIMGGGYPSGYEYNFWVIPTRVRGMRILG